MRTKSELLEEVRLWAQTVMRSMESTPGGDAYEYKGSMEPVERLEEALADLDAIDCAASMCFSGGSDQAVSEPMTCEAAPHWPPSNFKGVPAAPKHKPPHLHLVVSDQYDI